MKILFVSKYYYPDVGGVQTQTRLVANRLALTHEVAVVVGRPGPDYQDGAVPVRHLSPRLAQRLRVLPAIGTLAWTGAISYERVRALAYAEALRPFLRGRDIVHCVTLGYLGWAAQLAAEAEHIPFVLTPYIHPGSGGDSPKAIELCKKAGIVFALLESDRDYLISRGVPAEKIRLSGVVPLLPATTDPTEFRRRRGLDEAPVVLFVGRIAPHKGYRELLAAADIVWRSRPEVRFVFIGPGDDDARRAFAEKKDHRIAYLGEVTEQEKGDALAACALLCLPSTAEILPAAYLEAWSYGKPVIGGEAQGLFELIEGNGAGLIARQQPSEIAARVLTLLNDDHRRREMGARGQALVAQRFSEPALIRTLEAAYAAASSAGGNEQPCAY